MTIDYVSHVITLFCDHTAYIYIYVIIYLNYGEQQYVLAWMISSTKDAAFGQAPMTGVCQMLHQGAVCQMHDHGICVDLLGLTG